jgi:hypothetical protein
MSQLNIQMSAAFEQKLKRYMRARGIKKKSDAMRQALDDAMKLPTKKPTKTSFRDLLGSANKFPQRPRREWLSEDDLWEPNGR